MYIYIYMSYNRHPKTHFYKPTFHFARINNQPLDPALGDDSVSFIMEIFGLTKLKTRRP